MFRAISCVAAVCSVGMVAYKTSKAAVNAYTQSLAIGNARYDSPHIRRGNRYFEHPDQSADTQQHAQAVGKRVRKLLGGCVLRNLVVGHS